MLIILCILWSTLIVGAFLVFCFWVANVNNSLDDNEARIKALEEKLK